MVFIESACVYLPGAEPLTDEEYWSLQWHLALSPKIGEVIQGTGGLRKARWASGGGGKRGGVRVIYFHAVSQSQVRLLLNLSQRRQGRFVGCGEEDSSQARRIGRSKSMNKKLAFAPSEGEAPPLPLYRRGAGARPEARNRGCIQTYPQSGGAQDAREFTPAGCYGSLRKRRATSGSHGRPDGASSGW
jgi:hypothetical protein